LTIAVVITGKLVLDMRFPDCSTVTYCPSLDNEWAFDSWLEQRKEEYMCQFGEFA